MEKSSNIIGLGVMFLVGLLAGFFGRPVVMGNETTTIMAEPEIVVVTATPDPNATTIAAAPSSSGEKEIVVVTATPSPTPDYMVELLANARHFQGDQAAPITMIEFSDFK